MPTKEANAEKNLHLVLSINVHSKVYKGAIEELVQNMLALCKSACISIRKSTMLHKQNL